MRELTITWFPVGSQPYLNMHYIYRRNKSVVKFYYHLNKNTWQILRKQEWKEFVFVIGNFAFSCGKSKNLWANIIINNTFHSLKYIYIYSKTYEDIFLVKDLYCFSYVIALKNFLQHSEYTCENVKEFVHYEKSGLVRSCPTRWFLGTGSRPAEHTA